MAGSKSKHPALGSLKNEKPAEDDEVPLEDDDDDDTVGGWDGYYRCDDLVPPKCDDDLKVTKGSVKTLRGVEVAYWRYTPPKSIPSKFPIVAINGGPGLPHNSIKPTRNFACDGREVIMYDQAGTGASQLSHNDTRDAAQLYPELFTIEYYAETELPALIQELGLERYHILAESWGTQVAFQFAVSTAKDADGLQSLILNAPIADNHRFIEYQWDPVDGTVGTFPTYTLERLKYFNKTQDFDNEEFQALQENFVSEFNSRLGVLVDCWMETEDAGISELELERLAGATDLFIPSSDANLHEWTVLPQLHKLRDIPVQLNYGKFDFVRPRLIADTAAALQSEMVECHMLAHSAHSVLLDAPSEVYPEIQDFLLRVESRSVPFVANGVCPGAVVDDHHLGIHQRDGVVSFSAGWLLAIVGSVAVMAFSLGLWLGKREHCTKPGYEPVEQVSMHHVEHGELA